MPKKKNNTIEHDNEHWIKVRGASEHNLKNIDVDIPRDKLVVLTGVSGSGKSSLAFDTIFAEGQRRYMESLSSYARQFLGQMEKPKVTKITGLSPSISIDQKSTNRNPRSTVGTVTEIYDYLRLLYARCGTPHCPKCGKEIRRQTIDEVVDAVMKLSEGTKVQLLSWVVKGQKGRHEKVLESAKKTGYIRAKIDGIVYDLQEDIKLDKNKKHDIEIVVDRLIIKEGIEKRLTDSIEQVFKMSDGLLQVEIIDDELTDDNYKLLAGDNKKDSTIKKKISKPYILNFSQHFSCPDCGISIEEIEPRSFSFNNPYGACPDCSGLGYKQEFNVDLMIPDDNLSINEGAIVVPGWQSSGKEGSYSHAMLLALAKKLKFSLDTPFKKYPKKIKDIILYGYEDSTIRVHYESTYSDATSWDAYYEGLIENVRKRYEMAKDEMKQEYEKFMTFLTCETCHGQRLRESALAVTIESSYVGAKLTDPKNRGKALQNPSALNISEVCELSIGELYEWISSIKLPENKLKVADLVIREIKARLKFLIDVGLSYLALSRMAATLSGGEAQRIRLATQIGTGLVGVCYILDEPSIGLHQRDNTKLINTLKNLRDIGNTVLVVEHDEETMRSADYIVDIGPLQGSHGGEVVACGTVEDIENNKNSITGQFLSHSLNIDVPKERRVPTDYITIKGAKKNNLKNIDVKIPLSVFTCVTGVSGSGKSSLINEILYKHLAKILNGKRVVTSDFDTIDNTDKLDKIIMIDQSPIGRTPRSNPATYTGVYDLIRDLFASTPEAKERGYAKGRFSFNLKGGRCEACEGDGIKKIEMHFLPDVYVPCDICHGKKYNRETLEVLYKGKNIYDVLNMTVEEACEFFQNIPRIMKYLSTLRDVGLSYIKLGQSSVELSGGEAQRIKLATELAKRATGRTIYLLDEPTTGLHFYDVKKLVDILQKLTSQGNTVVVIEHNLDVIKTADYIIDLGPESGDEGGNIVCTGTPEELAKCKTSWTGKYLKPLLVGK